MKSKNIFSGIHRNVAASGLTSFFTDISTKMVYSIMPLFLMSIGASKTAVSLIEGIAESTASLLKAVSGYWSDKIGRNKPFMVLGYGITALVTPLYAWVTAPFQVLMARFTERLGKGLRAAPRDSLIAASIDRKDAGKNFGFQKAMDNSGAIIGPLLASLVLYLMPDDYRSLFLLATVPALLAVPVGYLSDRIGRERLIAAGFAVYAVTYALFGRLNSFGAFIPLFVLYGVYSALTDVSQKSFISDITTKEMKGTGYGLYHATLGLTLLPASLIGGWMYDHINNRVPFYFGAATAAIACGLMCLFFIGKKRSDTESAPK